MIDIAGVALHVAAMKRNQWKSAGELRRIREEKLRSLVRHCKANVPFYKRLHDGLPDIRDMSDLESIKPLMKEDIRGREKELIARNAGGKLTEMRSSGSTGIPLSTYLTGRESAYILAIEAHQYTEAGLSPFHKQARICDYRLGDGVLQRLGLFRRSYIDVQGDLEGIYGDIAGIRPDVIHGYPSVLTPLARMNAGRMKVKIVFSASETLPDNARRAITSSFGCDLRNMYGSMETSWIAWECEEGSMHINSDSLIAEVVDKDGMQAAEGAKGAILITPLWKKAMPLLRYRVGDRGAISHGCGCGRESQIFSSLEGREDDWIVLPSGKVRSARSINLMDDIRGFGEYQIVQEQRDCFVFRYSPLGGPLDERTRAEITRRIKAGCLGEPVRVEFEEAKPRRGAAGKIRTVISKVRMARDTTAWA